MHRELAGGEVLGFGGGAHVIANPGGNTMLGVFNADRQAAAGSFRRLAELDVSLVCVGHGDPLTGDASARLRAVPL
ncbi:hypothetical protein ABGB14_17225 [Nonomuraea sp. B10E15]|uniref:hypothetical protein n=1 Tax=Nonomuraea sp. B10E15 TaxID=3153560 RepID=UPI00325CC04D